MRPVAQYGACFPRLADLRLRCLFQPDLGCLQLTPLK